MHLTPEWFMKTPMHQGARMPAQSSSLAEVGWRWIFGLFSVKRCHEADEIIGR
jgi:hypothetical protein